MVRDTFRSHSIVVVHCCLALYLREDQRRLRMVPVLHCCASELEAVDATGDLGDTLLLHFNAKIAPNTVPTVDRCRKRRVAGEIQQEVDLRGAFERA